MKNDSQEEFDYPSLALRTSSRQFNTHLVAENLTIASLRAIANNCEQLDKIKKALFYGKNEDFLRPEDNESITKLHSHAEGELMHGIIGVITEAGELAEILLKRLETGQKMDMRHINEEQGDGYWYNNLIHNSLQEIEDKEAAQEQVGPPFDYSELATKIRNIEKLAARYPDKFSSERALNRDLTRESQILGK